MLILIALGRDSFAGQPLLVTGPRLPSRSYKVICDWSMLVLDQELHQRTDADITNIGSGAI